MATALDMIKKSLRLFSAIGQANPNPSSGQSTDALASLNSMLESWSIERFTVYQILEETFSWPSGQSSRTIGSGGNFSTTRPTRIADGFTRISDIDYPYRSIDKNQYDAIAAKTTQSSYPDVIFYDPAATLGVLYAYPVPSATVSIKIKSWKQLQSFAALTDNVTLPPGYQRAIEYNLAIELQGEYPDLPLSDSVVNIAQKSLAAIKKFNTPTLISRSELTGRRYNIFADY